MIFKQKSLSELIADFQKQVSERKKKINTRIANLEEEAGQIRAGIEIETQSLVEYELNNDSASAEKAQKVISKLNLRLVEVENLIAAYCKQLKRKESYTESLEKIRVAAAREREARRKKLNELTAQTDNIKLQIEELEKQLNEIERERKINRTDKEIASLNLLSSYIVPSLKKIRPISKGDVREQYISYWIDGKMEAAQKLLDKYTEPEVSPEPEVIHLNQPLYNHVTVPQEQPKPKIVERIYTTFGEGTRHEQLDEKGNVISSWTKN